LKLFCEALYILTLALNIAIPLKPFVDDPKDKTKLLMQKQIWTKKKGA